jgi:hypothetical protein
MPVRSFVASMRVLAVSVLIAAVSAACSSGHSVATDPCSLLTRSEIATAIHGDVNAGERVQAIGETDRRMCSYRVSTALRTVTVYLGSGHPPHGSGTSWSGASVVRGNAYVSVSAQVPDRNFARIASTLAKRAIERSATV